MEVDFILVWSVGNLLLMIRIAVGSIVAKSVYWLGTTSKSFAVTLRGTVSFGKSLMVLKTLPFGSFDLVGAGHYFPGQVEGGQKGEGVCAIESV
jgi:hypothetical protein